LPLAVVNERLGKYELVKRIAVGGMGEIFLARERGVAGFDRMVVVKRLLPDYTDNPDLVNLFIDEARIAAHLSHPNIVHIHDFGREADSYYLTMEYVAGHNLLKIAERAERTEQPLSIVMSVHIIAEMARGLDAAHRAKDADGIPLGIVHRDISPHNVLVSYGGDVKLMDFGIAKASNKHHRTEAGVIRGKLSYMSPEQANGDELDARSDIFSTGIVLYELTTGVSLFDGDNAAQTIRMVLEKEIPSPREVDPDYPPALEGIVMGALERRPSDRIASAEELASSLRAFLAMRGETVEPDELGAFVRQLFPKDLGELSDEELSAGTSSYSPTREIDGTQPLAAETSASADPFGSTPDATSLDDSDDEIVTVGSTRFSPEEAVDETAELLPVRSRRAWLSAIVLLAVGGSVAVWQLGLFSEAENTIPRAATTPSDAAAIAVVALSDAAPLIDPDAAVLAIKASPDARIRTSLPPRPPRKGPDSASRTVVVKPPPPIDPAPDADDPKPKPAEYGVLVVGVDKGWANVSLNGRSLGKTPLRKKVPPGTHELRIVLAAGGGTKTKSFRIESNKTTKCKVRINELRCKSPR